MATTTKSTKAKTKTKTTAAKARTTKATATKRAPAKTTKKTTATRTTKKTVTKKAAVKTATIKPVPKGDGLLARLNALSAFMSIALIAAAATLMNANSYQLVSGFQAKNELAGEGSAPFASAVNHVADLEIRWALVALLVVSAIVPILALTIKKNRYAAAIKNRKNVLRWAEASVVGALMIEVTALLSGVNEILTLKLMAAFVLIAGALAWVSEKRFIQAGRPVKSELYIGVFASVMPWIIIAGYALGTYAHGLIRSPWYVYALYAVLAIASIGYCRTFKRFLKGKTADYAVTERNYVVISIATKIAFAAVLIAGFAK